jgi:Domain of unknown function (DUF5667)
MNINHEPDELDPLLASRFSKLRVVPARNPERAAAGRLAFLNQGRELAQKNPPTVPVSPASRARLKIWMPTASGSFSRRQTRPMFTKVMAVLIAMVLVFSGAAATAYASQSSLPTDTLYGVKTFGENLQLRIAPKSDDKLGLALEFAQRRVDEMAALSQLGLTIPVHAATQYQEQVEYALQLAAGLSDLEIVPALEQIRTRLQEQLNTLEQLSQANPNDHALILARDLLREQLRLAEAGRQDPQQFRTQMQTRERLVQQTLTPLETEEPDPTMTPGANNSNTNANGNTNGSVSGNENGNTNDDLNGNDNEDANSNGNGDDHGGNANDDDRGGNGNENDNGNGGSHNGNGNDNDNDHNGNGNGNGNGNVNDNDKGGGNTNGGGSNENGANGNGHS